MISSRMYDHACIYSYRERTVRTYNFTMYGTLYESRLRMRCLYLVYGDGAIVR